MSATRRAANALRRAVGDRLRARPRLRAIVVNAENLKESLRHSVAAVVPAIIRPRPYKVMIAITAQCNARCIGCRYGRDFMPGHQLSLAMVRDLLDDAKQAGFYSIRFYGGEPLLHPQLADMISHAVRIGLRPYVTTNAAILGSRIDELYDAGLRDLSVGFYGVGREYDEYTQRPGLFAKVEASIAHARERYGSELEMQMNWLLMRPRANLDSFTRAWAFAERYHMPVRVDLVHYSLPYFQEGPDRELQFRGQDLPAINLVVDALLVKKRERPDMIQHSVEGLRSIPDWLIRGPDMRVPCTAYEMIWVGADGTVQLCYVTFKLGNLHERRLRDLLFTAEHRRACRDAFGLACPNCHCSSNERVMRHAPTRRAYSDRS